MINSKNNTLIHLGETTILHSINISSIKHMLRSFLIKFHIHKVILKQ